MPKSKETKQIEAIWEKHVTDNHLSDTEARDLAYQEPQQVALQIKDLQSFDFKKLRNSFRSVRSKYPDPYAIMQHNQQQSQSPKRKYDSSGTNNSCLFGGAPRPPSNNNLHGGNFFGNMHANGPSLHGNGNMFQDNNDHDNFSYSPKRSKFSHTGPPSPVDSLQGADVSDLATSFSNSQIDHPLENHKFRSLPEFLRMATPLISNLSNNSADYEHQLTEAMKGDTKKKIKFNGELKQSDASVEWMRKEVSQDKQAYAYQLSGIRKDAAIHRARLAELEAQERSLMSQQILSAGYAEAIRNIEEALLEFDSGDMEDLTKVEEAMNRWRADVSEEQKVLLDGKEKPISDILDKINGV